MLSRLPELGAVHKGDGRTQFTVWAPKRKHVDVVIDGRDWGDAFPDPCSRFQPEGPHGPSHHPPCDRSRFAVTALVSPSP